MGEGLGSVVGSGVDEGVEGVVAGGVFAGLQAANSIKLNMRTTASNGLLMHVLFDLRIIVSLLVPYELKQKGWYIMRVGQPAFSDFVATYLL
ncbi:hypothetical protein ACFLYR_05000 [Chloroflexota bacterium]